MNHKKLEPTYTLTADQNLRIFVNRQTSAELWRLVNLTAATRLEFEKSELVRKEVEHV